MHVQEGGHANRVWLERHDCQDTVDTEGNEWDPNCKGLLESRAP